MATKGKSIVLRGISEEQEKFIDKWATESCRSINKTILRIIKFAMEREGDFERFENGNRTWLDDVFEYDGFYDDPIFLEQMDDPSSKAIRRVFFRGTNITTIVYRGNEAYEEANGAFSYLERHKEIQRFIKDERNTNGTFTIMFKRVVEEKKISLDLEIVLVGFIADFVGDHYLGHDGENEEKRNENL